HGPRTSTNHNGIFARLPIRKPKSTQPTRYRFCLMQPQWEVADVLRKVDFSNQNFTVHQEKTLRALTLCRTAALGGHVDACDACGNTSISYNSCRNRYCPTCPGHKPAPWIQARERHSSPCSYYLVVFTIPDSLAGLA